MVDLLEQAKKNLAAQKKKAPIKKKPVLKRALKTRTIPAPTTLIKDNTPQETPTSENRSMDERGDTKIMLFTGYESAGKSAQANTFETPFLIGTEKKTFILVKYPPIIAPEVGEMKENKDFAYVTEYIDGNIRKGKDFIKTYNNIKYWCNWFMDEGYKTHKTLIIDVIKDVWDAAWGTAEQRKGSSLGKNEFIAITKELKSWFIPLMDWCDEMDRNLIIISHTTEKYIDVSKFESIVVGEVPDAKYWIRKLVSWRIDFLTPEQMNFKYGEKFIARLAKAPGQQNYKIDVTNKRISEILDDSLMLDMERESFLKMDKLKKLKGKKKEAAK